MTDTHRRDKRVELKYILDANLSSEVKQWAREHLGIDQHCNDVFGDSYEVNTLYLDTPQFDLFHRNGIVGRSKHRVRRYGDEPILWLESKRKKGDVVRKNRTAIREDEVLTHLSAPTDLVPWCGDWFFDRIMVRKLQPIVQVHYRRFARTATIEGECLRLTIDNHLHASRACGWNVGTASDAANLAQRIQASEVEILELKFHNHMPHLFRELLRTFSIPATGFSKYRTAVEAWNLNFPTTNLLSTCGEIATEGRLSNA